MEINYDLKLLKAAEVASVLNISISQVYRLMQTGEIPTVRMNRSVRIRQVDLKEFIKSHLYIG